jgi:hypothetical protein
MLLVFGAVQLLVSFTPCCAMYENERMVEYEKRNYTWPPQRFVPDTPGWKALHMERFGQIQRMDTSGDRYEGYLQAVHSALLAPNFTELGFGLARASDDLMVALRQGIRDGLAAGPREEGTVDVIGGPHKPWFVDREDLTQRVLNELQPYAEAWSGTRLVPHKAYGFRLYRNESALYMHVDKPETHIVSLILHIDSSEDAEPWPIFIEDFQGNTHEVILTSGDVLFYESSKCFHGRPRAFKGTWYSSIFVHYYPVGWDEISHKLETHFAVPPQWKQDPVATPSTLSDGSSERATARQPDDRLQMAGTSMLQPDCPDQWCLSQKAIKWSGPGEPGYWISPDFRKIPLNLSAAPSLQQQAPQTRDGGAVDGEL